MSKATFLLVLFFVAFSSAVRIRLNKLNDPADQDNDDALKRATKILRDKMVANPRPTVPVVDENPGYIKFRLQIPTPDTGVMMCVTRIRQPISYLGIAKCSYDNDQFFMYNKTSGKLHSFGSERDGHWMPALDGAPPKLASIFPGNRKPWILSQDPAPLDPWLWMLRMGNAGRAILRNMNYGPTGGRCMQVLTDGFQMYLFAKYFHGDASVCGMFFFMLRQDDMITGPIYHFKMNSTTTPPSLTWSCATLDPSAVAPTSAIMYKDCDPTNVYQRFKYNMITRHLRSAETDDVLFFWWRGPIRTVSLAPTTPGYGWDLPFGRAGPIVANDDRGYSGVCWNTNPASNRVEVGQTCGTYSMIPEQDNMLSLLLNRDLQYTSVVVSMNRDNATDLCLTIHAANDDEDTDAPNKSVTNPWFITMELCDYENYRLDQRFVFASPSCDTDNDAQCQGILRWAGDLSQGILPAHWVSWLFTEDQPLMVSMVDQQRYTYTMTFPVAQPGFVTMRRPERAVKQACWSGQVQEGASLFASVSGIASLSGACAQFQLIPTSTIPPDSNDDQITTFERFDHRWVMAVQTKAKTAGASDHNANGYFLADVGRTGVRRFHVLGSGISPQPTGALQTNTDPKSPNGIIFPFMRSDYKNSEYVSIHVYFSVDYAAVQARASNSAFVLMSFMRWSGCVVYLTFGGKPGIRCKRDGQVFVSNQVKTWPQNIFDGNRHKASLLLSRSSPGFISLYIDGQIIFNLTRSQPWSLAGASQSVAVFHDPYLWQFAPLPASLWRFSVIGTNNVTKAQKMAMRKSVQLTSDFQGDLATVVTAPTLTTQWKQCSLIKGTGVHYQGLICTLVPIENGVATSVPIDLFSLACSRPRCTISFLPAQPKLGSAFKFMYRPNYPTNFTSENVGNPDLFQDPAQITDGFRTLTLSIGLKFSPDGATISQNNGGNNLVELSDFIRYSCQQSCCVSLNGITATNDLWNAVF